MLQTSKMDVAVRGRFGWRRLGQKHTAQRQPVHPLCPFREGWLKGFVIGGGVRYQSATDLGVGLDVNGDFVRLEGNSRFESDLMLSYKFRKLFGLNNVSVQLNVKNALDNEDPR
jgi:outer membrane receptor protein involved in Fe transport